jgi:hypothetical protein
MAVDKVTGPIFATDTGSGGAASESATLVYEVSFTTNTETAVDALTADDGTTAVPSSGDQHPSDTTLRVSKKRAARTGKVQLFRVIVEYSTNSTTSVGDSGTSPLSRPTRWSEGPRAGSIEIDTDATGTVIQNSAKQTVVTQIPYSDITFTAVKNLAAQVDYDAYYNKVNDDVFEGYAAKRLLLTGVSQQFTEELYEGTVIQYYTATYVFELNIKRTNDVNEPDTWEQRILDEGTAILNGTDIEAARDRYNTLLTDNQKLDGSGGLLPSSGTPLFLNTSGATPTAAGKVAVFQEADFDLLGL